MEILLQHPDWLIAIIIQAVALVWWFGKLNAKIDACIAKLASYSEHDNRIKAVELSHERIMAKLEVIQDSLRGKH